MNDQQQVLEKLDTIIGLLAIQGKDKDQQIKILHELDFNSKVISKLTGIPDGTIRSIKSRKLKSVKSYEESQS